MGGGAERCETRQTRDVHYLDHAATTPLRESAREAWLAAASIVGNPASTHTAGQTARRVLEDSREQLAAALDCEPIEVVFTSGGTESINLALKGLYAARARGANAIVLPDGEHHATLESVAALQRGGAVVVPAPINQYGQIETDAFAAALAIAAGRAGLATALVANNETGSINPVAEIAQLAAEGGVALHLDAVAAFGHIPVSFASLRGTAAPRSGLVAMSVAAHKLGGPVGIGALVVQRTAKLDPQIHGGAAQRTLRAGTQDIAGAAAFAAAATEAIAELAAEAERLTLLRDRLADGIRSTVPAAVIMGAPGYTLPGTVHALFPGAVNESMQFVLDTHQVAVSTGAACQAGAAEPSHVVLAAGRSEPEARSALRFTLGRTSTDADVDALLAHIADAYARS